MWFELQRTYQRQCVRISAIKNRQTAGAERPDIVLPGRSPAREKKGIGVGARGYEA